jgi:hypothetical protein
MRIILGLLVAVISGFLFRAGGSAQWEWAKFTINGKKVYFNQKLWRWLMGIPIGLILWHGYLAFLLTVGAYFLATNVFGYGDKSVLNKYLSQNMTHAVSGAIFGLASFPLIGWWALLQAVISGVAFYLIETKKVNNPWAERAKGFFGTILG